MASPTSDSPITTITSSFLLETRSKCRGDYFISQDPNCHEQIHTQRIPKRGKPAIRRERCIFICPEATCVHHDPSRALSEFTGIKKHFCRKHGEKNGRVTTDKCSIRYAVQSDWKVHSKTCGTREYWSDCGTLFSRWLDVVRSTQPSWRELSSCRMSWWLILRSLNQYRPKTLWIIQDMVINRAEAKVANKFLAVPARSKINIENRKKLKTNHTCGSRLLPISAIIAAEANEGELDFVEFYKQTHYSKKKNDFVTLGNQELYENLAKAQSEYCSQPDAIPLTGEELSIMVLKPRSGYIKGLGLRPSSSRGSFTMSSRTHADHIK